MTRRLVKRNLMQGCSNVAKAKLMDIRLNGTPKTGLMCVEILKGSVGVMWLVSGLGDELRDISLLWSYIP